MRAFLSAYEAKRAAPLAGVPERTLYDWAQKQIITPSVSSERGHMRWSYSDLVTARLVYWLRHEKASQEPPDEAFRGSKMGRVRDLLSSVEGLGEALQDNSVVVKVDRGGRIILTVQGREYEPLGLGYLQGMEPGTIQLLQGFRWGPNLWKPRERIRIIPGTLSGQPHIAGKRVPTELVKDLADQRFPNTMIRRAYPELTDEEIGDAVSLERDLQRAA